MLSRLRTKYYPILFALLTACLSSGVLTAQAETKLPRLQVDQSIFDFGKVMQGTQVVHDFTLRNVGDAPLEIDKVQPSCGCTAVASVTDVIEPGAEVQLRSTFDTSGFYGYKVKTIRVFSNDPTQASTVLSLRGTVQRDVEVSPPRVYFGAVDKGRSPTKSLTLTRAAGSKIQIGEVTSHSDKLTVSVEELKAGGKKVSVTLSDQLPVGTFRSRLSVKTSSDKNPVITVPVFAKIQGDLRLTPLDVSFGLHEGPLESALEEEVLLENHGDVPVSVTGVSSDSPLVSATVAELEKGKRYQILVQVAAQAQGTVRAVLTIETDHPDRDQQQLNLPVYGIVARKKE